MHREKRTGAHVAFVIRIDDHGYVTSVVPIVSPDMAVAFDAGGILRTWKFQPALLEGKSVPCIVKVEINIAY